MYHLFKVNIMIDFRKKVSLLGNQFYIRNKENAKIYTSNDSISDSLYTREIVYLSL